MFNKKNKVIALAMTIMMMFTFTACNNSTDVNSDTSSDTESEYVKPGARGSDDSGDVEDLTKLTVVLDWTPNTNHTGLYVAKDMGYYQAQGLEVEIIQPPEGGALALVASGKADFAISFQEEVLMAVNADTPLPIVAVASVVEHNTGGIISLKEKGIESFKDMEGKSYGSWEMPIYDEIIYDCIEADGGDSTTVEMVPNSATDSIAGIQNDFDAVWVYEGWDKVIADLQGIETNFIKFTDVNPVFDYYTPVIVTSENFKTEQADTLEKFLMATGEGYTYAKENPQSSADILIANSPELDQELTYASQEFLSAAYFSDEWGVIDEVRWTAFFDWMKEKELVSADANNLGL